MQWRSRKQKYVAIFPTHAEYIALFEGFIEIAWLESYLNEINRGRFKQWPIEVRRDDDQSAIALASNVAMSDKSKHFCIKLHYCREREREKRRGTVLSTMSASDHAYMCTKALNGPKVFKTCVERVCWLSKAVFLYGLLGDLTVSRVKSG